jgi:signal transduction histidine kinase
MKPFIAFLFLVWPRSYDLRHMIERNLLLVSLILAMTSVNSFCQKADRQSLPELIQQNIVALGPAWNFVGDTSEFAHTSTHFRRIVSQRSLLDLDSLRQIGHLALLQAQKVHYSKGVMDVCLGFSAAYVDKYAIDSAKYYSIVATQIAEYLKDRSILIRSHLSYGWALIYDHSDYDGADSSFRVAYELAKSYGNNHLIKESLTRLVKINYLKWDLVSAYRFNKELAELCKVTMDVKGMVNANYMLASLYAEMDLSDRQFEVAIQCLQLVKTDSDTQTRYIAQNTAAYAYFKKGLYDSAIYYAHKNIPLARRINKYPSCLTYLAKAFLEKNQLDSARYYFEKMLRYAEDNRSYIDIFLYHDLGEVEFRAGNFAGALSYFQLAELNIEKPSVAVQSKIYKSLYNYYVSQGDVDRASYYLHLYSIKVDSIRNVQNSFKVDVAAIEYEAEKLYAQLQLVTKDKELQATLLEKHKQQESMIMASIIFCVGFLLMGFLRYRRQKDHKAKQALMKERLRISRELHDEVGSTLSGIAMYTHLASNQVKNALEKEAQRSLSIMQTSASEMVTKLSDIVWLINPEQDTISELFDRLEVYACQMASAKDMKVRMDVHAGIAHYHIPMEARRNIYLFCKEAINNAVKYSNGSQIELKASVAGNLIKVSVKDDGQGFDELTIRRGNGLRNMIHRAQEIGAHCHIASRVNEGSQIEMQYNLTH